MHWGQRWTKVVPGIGSAGPGKRRPRSSSGNPDPPESCNLSLQVSAALDSRGSSPEIRACGASVRLEYIWRKVGGNQKERMRKKCR